MKSKEPLACVSAADAVRHRAMELQSTADPIETAMLVADLAATVGLLAALLTDHLEAER